MFLFERIFGVACYFIVLLIVFFAIYYQKIRVKDTLIFYVLILTLFAYFYKPPETADLYRIWQTVESFAEYNFIDFYKVHLLGNSTPISYLLYWIIGKTGNVNLLPSVTVLVTYSVFFYILYKSFKRFSLDNEVVATVLLFIMSTGSFMMTVSGIRNMLAISLLSFCFFRESVLKTFKIWHLFLYLVAAFIHNLAIILLMIRFVAFVISANLKPKWKILSVTLFTVFGLFSLFRFNWLFNKVFEKAYGYITGDTYSYIWEYIIGIIALIIEMGILLLYKKSSNFNLKECWMYLFLCVAIALIFIGQYSIFHRFVTYVAPVLAIPLLICVMSVSQKRSMLVKTLFCLSAVMLVISCARGELSALKFFVLK